MVVLANVLTQFDHDAYGRAISGHAASMASGSWMTAKTSAGGRDGEEVYRHPHLAALAKKGYTFNDIQSAGNRLGLTSFNSENDAKQISKLLDEREGAYARGLVDDLRKEQGEKGSEDAKPYEPSERLKNANAFVNAYESLARDGKMNPFATGNAQGVTTSMNFDTRADELGAERSDVKTDTALKILKTLLLLTQPKFKISLAVPVKALVKSSRTTMHSK